MSTVEKAVATQLANIEERTGKSIAELTEIIRNCGLTNESDSRNCRQGACATTQCALVS